MHIMRNGPVEIAYEVDGSGFPILLLAPGGLGSNNEKWRTAAWNPHDSLASEFRLIGMDQRNAGSSFAPIAPTDGWHSYLGDQVALLDHLSVDKCHLIGACIGGPFILNLLCHSPERFCSAVIMQPTGIDDNRESYKKHFDEWWDEARSRHPEATDAQAAQFGSNIWDAEAPFLSVSEDQVAACVTPLLILMGLDFYHPQSVSRQLAKLCGSATLLEDWKRGDALARTERAIHQFLHQHAPEPVGDLHEHVS